MFISISEATCLLKAEWKSIWHINKKKHHKLFTLPAWKRMHCPDAFCIWILAKGETQQKGKLIWKYSEKRKHEIVNGTHSFSPSFFFFFEVFLLIYTNHCNGNTNILKENTDLKCMTEVKEKRCLRCNTEVPGLFGTFLLWGEVAISMMLLGQIIVWFVLLTIKTWLNIMYRTANKWTFLVAWGWWDIVSNLQGGSE